MTIFLWESKGKLLYDTKKDEAKYRPIGSQQIPPDTAIERLADIVCKCSVGGLTAQRFFLYDFSPQSWDVIRDDRS